MEKITKRFDENILLEDLINANKFLGKLKFYTEELFRLHIVEYDKVEEVKNLVVPLMCEFADKADVIKSYIQIKKNYNNELMQIFLPTSDEKLKESREEAQEILRWWINYDREVFGAACNFRIFVDELVGAIQI